MSRIVRITLVLFLAILTPVLLLGYEVPKDLVIKRPDKNPPLATWVQPVSFPHGKHAVLNPCGGCHHEESDRNLGEFLKCSQCHNKPGMEETKSAFYLAWHNSSPRSCLGCHRKVRLEKRGMPPISCVNGCHKKP